MATTASGPAGSAQQPYPTLPASPTLTNPDMILPDYDRTSSPDMDQDRSQSPLMMWKNAHAAATSSQLHQLFTMTGPPALPTVGPVTPTTPIIYGNGTMLSDIGEVTEVESTPGRPSPARRRGTSPGDEALRSFPTMGLEAVRKLQRQRSHDRARRSSLDSNSTITTQEQTNLFADFDDTVSVGDSVFQGDDEDSVADSYVPDEAPRSLPRSQSPARHDGLEDGRSSAERRAVAASDRQSAFLLSQRAEKILANAKRRLTTMEGNLNRARSSLHTSSPSISSLGSDGTIPSPTLQFRSGSSRDSTSSLGHTRMGSDNTLRIGIPVKVYPQRSASALGAAGGYRQPLTTSRSVDQIRESSRFALARPTHKPLVGHDSLLEPLNESEDSASRPHADAESSARDDAYLEGFLSPTFGQGYDGARVVTRSASTTRMRDLRDQVQDLKGKISNLRDQARADSLRRRSFQSLRTPSPFTHARVEQWCSEPTSDGTPDPTGQDDAEEAVSQGGELPNAEGDTNAGRDGDIAEYGRGQASSGVTPESEACSLKEEAMAAPQNGDESLILGAHANSEASETNDDDVSDMLTENGDCVDDQYETADAQGYESESGESAYHDTVQHPISHEDREDAFDYEHFILHSALGTMSQQRLARGDRSGSFSSDDSVETTRGPFGIDAAIPVGTAGVSKLRRRGSNSSDSTAASVGSVESFATADEGRRSHDGGRRTTDADRPRGQSRVREHGRNSTSPPADAASAGHGPLDTIGDGVGELRTSPPVATVLRRPASSAAVPFHRPSVSSFESTGTMRSFPLVTRKKAASVSLTGHSIAGLHSSSPDGDLRAISEKLMSEAAAIYVQQAGPGYQVGRTSPTKRNGSILVRSNTPAPMQQLPREDQFLVERLVAGIGRCVLGLSENGRAGSESRMYRRRLDAARRILEGIDSV
ncbi:hypothetical protein RB595_005437 [Gaeumannomyces hyphopodioides]